MGYRSEVRNLVVGLGRFWQGRPAEPARREPYAVPCRCGQVAHGLRRAKHHVIRCLACGEPVFVLPLGPYPPDVPHAVSPPPPTSHLPGWRLPALAGVLTLLAVVAVNVLLIYQLRETPSTQRTLDAAGLIDQHEANGKAALARREIEEARREFANAKVVYERQRDAVPSSRGRRLHQLHREVELLALRLPKPFELALQRWKMLEPEELDRLFADARGTAVFFDLELLRDAAGQYHYERRLGPELPTLQLHELKLLNRLPLQNVRQRVVFGALLDGLRRDAQDRFVVSFNPDSGVLVTEEEVARVVVPALEDNLRAVLLRQAEWANEAP
jgi:hypothetical protein